MSRRAGFDPIIPLRRIQGAPGPWDRKAILGIARPTSRQNGHVPRRNNARKAQGKHTGATDRIASLGEHWRADGLPKTGYAKQTDALTAALMRRQESGVELNVYRCDVCAAWHMGNIRTRGAGRQED
jgi:hypothetical protein